MTRVVTTRLSSLRFNSIYSAGLLARRLLPPPPQQTNLCTAASNSGLQTVLERHSIPPDAVPADADAHAVLRQLRFLETLGVSDMAGTVARDPTVLTQDTEKLAGRHIEYMLSLGIPKMGPMIEKVPQLLSCDLTHDFHRKVAILKALGIRKIGPWLYKNRGRVVTMDVDTDMRPPVEYLQSVKSLQVHKVLETLPIGVFGAGKKEMMEKRVNYLSEDLGVGVNRVGKMISRWPYVLTMSQTETIEPKVRAQRIRVAARTQLAICTHSSRSCDDEAPLLCVKSVRIS